MAFTVLPSALDLADGATLIVFPVATLLSNKSSLPQQSQLRDAHAGQFHSMAASTIPHPRGAGARLAIANANVPGSREDAAFTLMDVTGDVGIEPIQRISSERVLSIRLKPPSGD